MLRLSRIIFCCLSLWFCSQMASAAPYDDGLEAYESGEYSKAYKILGRAVKKTKNSQKKAEALALMGAAAAKMGKKDKASSLFKQARKLDDEVELPSAASDDKAVRKLFARAGGSRDGDERGSSKGKRGKKGPEFGDVQNYFPFGINQFLQQKTLLAVGLGGAQAFGIYLYLKNQSDIALANKDAGAAYEEYQSDPTEENKSTLLEFLDTNEAFVLSAQRNAQLSLLLAAGAYAASVYEALYSPFGSGKSSASLSPQEEEQGWVIDEIKTLSPSQSRELSYRFALLPTAKPSLVFDLKLPL